MPGDPTVALVSVFFHVLTTTRRLPVPEDRFHLPPAVEAAAVLREQRGALWEAHRRAAAAALAGWGAGNAELRAALTALVTPDLLAQIDQELREHPSLDGAAREQLTHGAILRGGGTGGGFYPRCPYTPPLTVVGRDPRTDGPQVTVTLSVQVDIHQVAARMDGQSWDRCSAFFPKTFTGRPPIDAVTFEALPVPNPPSPGSTWSDTLWEHFTLGGSWFKNLLQHDARWTGAADYRLDYHLVTAIRSLVAGETADRAGGLAFDAGHVVLHANAGWTEVEAVKSIKFVDRPPLYRAAELDALAGSLLWAMGSGTLAGACCDLPAPGPPTLLDVTPLP